MALLTLISLAAEVASNDKARENISKFANKGANFLKNLMKSEDDLPELTQEDVELIFNYTECLFGLLGLCIKQDNPVINKKALVTEEILERLCFSETGYFQEPVLKFQEVSKEDFLEMVSYYIQTPITIKKVSRFVKNYSLEYEFYEYLCEVAFSSSGIISKNDAELLDAVAESFDINRFDKKEIESKYKK